MADCGICGNSLYEEHGIEFYNSARFVITSDWFWEQKFATKCKSHHEKDASGGFINEYIYQ